MTILQQLTGQLRPRLTAQGYSLSQACFYRTTGDMAYCIQLEMPGDLVYAAFFVMPLYIPCESRYMTFGRRLHTLPHSRLSPLPRTSGQEEIRQWCDTLQTCLEDTVFPFFGKIATPARMIHFLEKRRNAARFLFCPLVEFSRLQLFTYFYLEDSGKLSRLLPKYPQVVQSSTFLTPAVRGQYLQELEMIRAFISAPLPERRNLCAKTITATRQTCFP